MRTARWWTCGSLLGCALLFGACTTFLTRYGIVENAPMVSAFRDGDVFVGDENYDEALRAYREVITGYPNSAYAEAAYLRIAHLYLNRTDLERGWEGWAGADYAAARDTLLALLRDYPRTQYRQEARNWIRVLDMALAADLRTVVIRDTVIIETAPVIPQQHGDSSAAWQRERARLQRTIRTSMTERNRFRTERDTSRAQNERLREENAELDAQVRRTRSEMERMKRMLVDLERRSGN